MTIYPHCLRPASVAKVVWSVILLSSSHSFSRAAKRILREDLHVHVYICTCKHIRNNMVEHSASIMPLMHMLVYVYMHVYEEHVLYAHATNVHIRMCKCNLDRLPSVYKHACTVYHIPSCCIVFCHTEWPRHLHWKGYDVISCKQRKETHPQTSHKHNPVCSSPVRCSSLREGSVPSTSKAMPLSEL